MAVDKKRIMEELETIMDPELGLDLVTLGLIYDVEIQSDKHVIITMTYTTPLCPFGQEMKDAVQEALYDLGFTAVEVVVTFDPPWKPPNDLRTMLGL